MKKIFTCTMLAAGILLFAFCFCELVKDNDGSGRDVSAIKIAAGEMSGWSDIPQDNEGKYATEDQLAHFINGGANKYVQYGLAQGFYQELNKEVRQITLYVMDMKDAKGATDMYNYWSISVKQAVDNYPENVAILDLDVLNGANAYAHFKKYYIEISLAGYDTQKEAIRDANNIIEVLEDKIQSLK